MTMKVQEINYLKGQVTHPNSISVGPGTFREIKNGWSLRDGIVDKRPGFSIQPNFPRAPGFSTQYNGMRSLNGNTYVRQDTGLCAYGFNPLDNTPQPQPTLVNPQAFYPITGADTIDCYGVVSVATDGTLYLAVGKTMVNFNHEPFLMLFSLATGELLATYADTGSSTAPSPQGITWKPDGSAFYFSRFDTNKIYKYTVSTGVVTTVAGSGTGGVATGSTLTSLNIGPIRGVKYKSSGGHDHIYACVSNTVYDCDLTADTGAIIAGAATSGHVNATGGSARFNVPFALDLFDDAPTNIYVSDRDNNAVRKVTTAGVVTDLNTSITNPLGLTCLSPKSGSSLTDLIYVVGLSGSVSVLNTLTTAGALKILVGTDASTYRDGPMADIAYQQANGPSFNNAIGCCVLQDKKTTSLSPGYLSPDVKIFLADSAACRVRCVDSGPDGCTVSTWAGSGGNLGVQQFYQKNNLLGFAGGVLPPPSNTIGAPAPNADVSQNIVPEFGFGMFEYNGTTYVNTNRGVIAFDAPDTYSISQIARYAGAPQGLDLILSLTSGTLLASGDQVAYRLCWGYKTASGRTVIGSPSSRNVVTAGSAQDVVIQSFIPPGVNLTWSYQLYRTKIVNGSDPGDTEFLVFEASPAYTDLQNGYITITDSTPDALIGADLYTNANDETLSQSNNQPPICQDMCLFGDLAVYANTIQKQTMFVNLVGTGGFSGSPTIAFTFSDSLNGFTLTGNSSTESASTGQFKYFTGGSPAVNIYNTAQSIVRTINQYTANRRVQAFYVSATDGVPGQIAIVGTFFGCPTFSIKSVSVISVDFSPPLPTSDATWYGPTYNSIAETRKNGIYVAKLQNPDAVPLVNSEIVGSSSEPIWRVLPLRTSVIIVKEKSIWRMTGSDASNVTISLLDNTVSLRSPASCALLNNEVYALTTQGVVAISDNGVRIVSRDIEWQLQQATGFIQQPMDLCNNAWGFGSEGWRQYFISVMFSETLQKTYVYCPLTSTWDTWDLFVYSLTETNGQIIAAVLDDSLRSSDSKAQKPYVISQNFPQMIQSAMSYADYGGQAQIATLSGNDVTLTYSAPQRGWAYGGATTPDVGWVLVSQDGESFYYVIANASGTLTLADATDLSASDTVDVWRPIDFIMRYNSLTAGHTFTAKQWGDMIAAIESRNSYQYSMGFLQNSSAEGTSFLSQTKVLNQLQPPGPNNNGSPPNAASLYLEQVQRLTIPKASIFGNILEWEFRHSEAFSYLVPKAFGAETVDTGSNKAQQ